MALHDNDKKTIENSPSFIIAVGASVGGVEAIEKLIRHLSNDIDAAYIIAQHISPSYPAILVEAIEQISPFKIVSLKRTQPLQKRTIYLAPPGKDIEYEAGNVRVLKPKVDILANPSINRLFYSLAHNARERAIGIVLSGTGHDGADGLKAIVKAGGYGLVQTPETAQYDGMPKAAIETSAVADVMPVDKMGGFLTRFANNHYKIQASDFDPETINHLVENISVQTGVDLKGFKKTTLDRRVVRRMSVLSINHLQEYFSYVCNNHEEAQRFTDSLSIAVTEFFRDKPIFEYVGSVFEQLLKNRKSDKDVLRLWVVGCATGQEAYSMAILLHEAIEILNIHADFHLFATDISDKLINEARRGIFAAEDVAEMDPMILKKYFEQRGNYYFITRMVRENIYFSTHNVIKDPPFSNIDFVSCRNVLIYLKAEAKNIALQNIAYALKPEGRFLIGNNELLENNDLWTNSSQSGFKLYRKGENNNRQGGIKSYQLPNINISPKKQDGASPLSIENQLSQVVCQQVLNPILLLDADNQVVYTLGDVGKIIDINQGPFDRHVSHLLKSEYAQVINALIGRFRKREASSTIERVLHQSGNQTIVVIAREFDPHRPQWVLLEIKVIIVDDAELVGTMSNYEREILSTIESELSLTKESLQLMIQELETKNEEIYLSNKELLTTNEELISTNEELYSTNEELVSLNEELENKTKQLQTTSTDLENLQKSIELPLVVVGRDLRVKRYVNAFLELLKSNNIRENDLITALDWKAPVGKLKEHILGVIEEGIRYRQQIAVGKKYYQLYVTPYVDEKKHIRGAIIFFTDITRLNNTQKALKEERELAHVTLESISDGVIRLNNHMQINYMNPAAEFLCGWSESEAISRHIADVVKVIDEDTRQPIKDIFTLKRTSAKPEVSLLINRENQQMTIEYICTPLTDGDHHRIGLLFVMRDVSERHAALKRVLWQSTHDHLTGLVNRQEMESRLGKSLAAAKDKGILSTFMFVDLDQFKIVNDTCGHLAGDELLRRITQQIIEQLRSRDTLARLGGDEFGILLENCAPENAYCVATKIRDVIARYRFVWDEKLFKVGACIGLIAINQETHSVTQLLRDADSACYAAKNQGGNNIQIHMDSNEELNEQRQQMSIITEINEALENQRLRLYYQPIINVATGKVSHWEVLVRMLNQRQEFLLPQQFLPASERFGFIRQIDHWVISHAARNLNELHKITDRRPKIAINLSANTLADKSCKEKLVDMFKHHPNLNQQLIFEITETSALSNLDSVNLLINQLRQFGCLLALDDFGTGVSTYSYLKRLDIDMIKIDGEFITDITENQINQEIVKSIIHIARLMEISTTAEWVDSEESYRYLKSIGIDSVQGNYLGHPIPAEEFLSAVLNDTVNLDSSPSMAHELVK